MKPQILLVEDDYAIQTTIKEYLEPAYNVTTADTAMQALENLQNKSFNVILVDLGLPDSSGLNVIKLALADAADIAVLALTGDRSSDSVHSAINAGVHDYLVKPINSTQLHDRVERAIQKLADLN